MRYSTLIIGILSLVLVPAPGRADLWDDMREGTENLKRSAQELRQSVENVTDAKATVDDVASAANRDDQHPQAENSQADWNDNPAAVRLAQMHLKRLGFDVTMDGSYGSGTRKAIMQFQADHHMPVTGDITQDLLMALARARPEKTAITSKSTTKAETTSRRAVVSSSSSSAIPGSYSDVVFLGTQPTDMLGFYLIARNPKVLDDDQMVDRMAYIMEGGNVLRANNALEREQKLKEYREKLISKASSMFPDDDITLGMIVPVKAGQYDKQRAGFPLFADSQKPWDGWSLAEAGSCAGQLCFIGTGLFTRIPMIPRFDSNTYIDFLKPDDRQYKLLSSVSRMNPAISAVVIFKISGVQASRRLKRHTNGSVIGVEPINLVDFEIQKVDLYTSATAKVGRLEFDGFLATLPLTSLDNYFKPDVDYQKIDLGEGFNPIYLPKMNGRYLVGAPLDFKLGKDWGYTKRTRFRGKYPALFTESWRRYFELFALKGSIVNMANAQMRGFNDQIYYTESQLVLRHYGYLPEWHYGEPGSAADEFARHEDSQYFQQKLAPQLASLPNLLPMPMLDVIRVFLGDYDFQSGQFNFEYIDKKALSTAYPASGLLDSRGFNGSSLGYSLADPAQAKALLERLPPNRQVYLAKEYTLEQLGQYIQERGVGGGATLGRLESAALYEDVDLTQMLANFGVAGTVASSAQRERPDSADKSGGENGGSQPSSNGGNCGVPTYTPTPAYPLKASSKNISGTVSLEIQIGPDGRVSSANIVQEDPQGWFGMSALKATRRMQWPADGGGFTCNGSWTFTAPRDASFR